MKEFKWLKRSADLKSNSAEGCPLKYLCTTCFQSRKICIKKKIKILQKLRRKGHYFLTNLSFWVTGSFHFCGNVFQNSDEFFFLRKLIVQGLSSTELESSQQFVIPHSEMNFILCILQQPEGKREKKKICVSKNVFYYISVPAGTINSRLIYFWSLWAAENEKKCYCLYAMRLKSHLINDEIPNVLNKQETVISNSHTQCNACLLLISAKKVDKLKRSCIFEVQC